MIKQQCIDQELLLNLAEYPDWLMKYKSATLPDSFSLLKEAATGFNMPNIKAMALLPSKKWPSLQEYMQFCEGHTAFIDQIISEAQLSEKIRSISIGSFDVSLNPCIALHWAQNLGCSIPSGEIVDILVAARFFFRNTTGNLLISGSGNLFYQCGGSLIPYCNEKSQCRLF